MDTVVEIEAARIRLGINKQKLCKAAKIKPEMYSYVLRRGRTGHDLPAVCLDKIRRALKKLG